MLKINKRYLLFKYAVERTLVIVTAPAWGLILLTCGLLLLIKEGTPVFYVQKRVGLKGKEFGCIKLRTMKEGADELLLQWKENSSPEWHNYVANGFKLKDDPRVSGLGKIYRKFSLDEVPQLINVLKGDMTLIGARPLIARETTQYGEENFSLYIQVKPGVTGLWQVSGRNDQSFEQRAELDKIYFEKMSFKQDFEIFLKTFKVVLSKKGAY